MSVKLKLNNFLINGCFEYWQRGTSFPAIASGAYSSDRWRHDKNGTMVSTISRSTDVPAQAFGQYSLLMTVTTAQASLGASSFCDIRQAIEGNVLRTFKDKKIALSFWVKSSKTGNFYMSARNRLATRSYVAGYAINQANVWERKIIRLSHSSVGSWDYNQDQGMTLRWALGYGSDFFTTTTDEWVSANVVCRSDQANLFDLNGATFQLADVCLIEDNEGQTRDPEFQLAGRDLFEELQLCQRYYEAQLAVDLYQLTHYGNETTGGFSNERSLTIWYKVTKRAQPSVVASGNGNTSANAINTQNFRAISTNIANTTYASVTSWTADAEL
jgi:hypothetical protein